jgi:hypothetical protein
MKKMLITFFDIKNTVNFEFIPQGQISTKLLKRLREDMHRERTELWPEDWIPHHESDPVNKLLSVKQFLAQKSITEIELPSYSPYFDSE